jgi:hypothetical protein
MILSFPAVHFSGGINRHESTRRKEKLFFLSDLPVTIKLSSYTTFL